MKRFPNGVDHDFFHQKRVPENHPPYVDEQYVEFPSGHSTVFAIVDNAAALAWVANLGCIELHTWHSRVPDIERPDYLLIDLDPTFEGQWRHVRKIALVVKDVMDDLGLKSFPKRPGRPGCTSSRRSSLSSAFPRCGGWRSRWRRRSSGGSATSGWRRRPGRWPTGWASSSTTARTRVTGRLRRRTRSGRFLTRGICAARLGRGRDREGGAFHADHDAQADRRGRRPDQGHVALQAKPEAALREARSRARRPEQGRERSRRAAGRRWKATRAANLAGPPSRRLYAAPRSDSTVGSPRRRGG